jgi:hypothetical protein
MATTKKVKTTTKRQAKDPSYKSFKLTKENGNFVTFRFTKQTLYWLILLVYILFLDVWIANAQMNAMILLV